MLARTVLVNRNLGSAPAAGTAPRRRSVT